MPLNPNCARPARPLLTRPELVHTLDAPLFVRSPLGFVLQVASNASTIPYGTYDAIVIDQTVRARFRNPELRHGTARRRDSERLHVGTVEPPSWTIKDCAHHMNGGDVGAAGPKCTMAVRSACESSPCDVPA